ncbi:MAG: hypothetical protein N2646_08105 [Bellilinea sp.]|nr:hypothetical protein [Bellilinea sp.]
MPVTPFHFGAGLAAKAALPARFGLLAFCAANVLIDIEPLYYAMTHKYPLHRFFHTLIGATILALITITLFTIIAWLLKKWRLKFNWLNNEFHPTSIWLGTLSGAYSHILLDSLVHEDMHPLSPFTQVNPFSGNFPRFSVETTLVFMGLLGILIIGIRFVFLHKK